jgi:hypothetical protein
MSPSSSFVYARAWWSQGESNPRPLECHSSGPGVLALSALDLCPFLAYFRLRDSWRFYSIGNPGVVLKEWAGEVQKYLTSPSLSQ